MNKRILLIIPMLLIAVLSFSQAWEWVETGVSDETDNSNEVCVDNLGNVYVIGETTNEITFGSVELTSTKEKFDFLVKYNSNGEVIWAVKLLESDDTINELRGITTDDAGNIIITGFFSNTISVSGIELTSLGMFDVFITKFDSNGDIVWAKSAGGTHNDQAYDIACDGQDYYLATGFTDDASFDDIQLIATSPNWNDEIAIVKYLSNGDVDWATRAGGLSWDNPTGIAYDGEKLYITGFLSSRDADFGTDILDCEGVTNVFLAQMDPTNGVFDWAKVFETGHITVGVEEKQGPHIVVDDNSIYMAGYYHDDFTFSESVTLNLDDDNAFIASFSKTGEFNWVKEITTTAELRPYPLSMSYSEGNIYLVGEYMNNITTDDFEMIGTQAGGMAMYLKNAYVFSYSTNGDLNWGKSIDAYFDFVGGSISLNGVFADTDKVYTCGQYSKTVQVGTFELVSEYSIDPFFGKIDITGNSISSFSKDINVDVFPNPASDLISISVTDEIISSVSIINVSGKVLYQEDISNEVNVDVDLKDLSQGIYILNIYTNKGVITRKIIKE